MRPGLEVFAERLLARLLHEHSLGYAPTLTWRNLRVTAGVAYYRCGEIALSRIVLTDEERVRMTLVHEYAHLLAVARHGTKAAGHGAAWRQAMRDLGEKPTVRHCYEVIRNASRQQVIYRCARCGTLVHRRRRLPRKRRYVHAPCGGALKLEAILASTPDA